MVLKAPWIIYPKEEGSPIHPDELNWECDFDICESCRKKYEAQLQAWRTYHGVE